MKRGYYPTVTASVGQGLQEGRGVPDAHQRLLFWLLVHCQERDMEEEEAEG